MVLELNQAGMKQIWQAKRVKNLMTDGFRVGEMSSQRLQNCLSANDLLLEFEVKGSKTNA
jgi:hypothetical protein